MTLDDVTEITGGALVGGSGEEVVTSVSTDTRTLRPGALFVALRGERHDGHDYVAVAKERGATALLVDHTLHGLDLPHVVVVDTLFAYGDLARAYRDTFPDLPVVGVTGSVGKTTTKELVAHVLASLFSVHKNEANFNNEVGVPLTIFGLQERHTALVLEMGMRGYGQILRLADIGRPTVGVITNVGTAHIELLGSRENIAEAKGELLQALPSHGLAVLPASDPFVDRLRARHAGETITCGVEAAKADVLASGLARHENGWRFTVDSPWGRSKMFVPSPGRFNVQNALFAVAVGAHLGIPLDSIARALNTWSPAALRMEVVNTPAGLVLLADAYNASPASMIGALETLRDMPVPQAGGRRIAVLGEMRELGGHSAEGHAEVGRTVAQARPDLLFLIGPLTDSLGEAAREAGYPAAGVRAFASTEEAMAVLPGLVRAGDAVLVKGSRALAMEQILAALGHEGVAHVPQ